MSGDAEAVVVDRVTKRFGSTTALDEVSFTVSRGEVFGFIGPDGGGKTTLFRILATLLLPDSGSARVLGDDVVKGIWRLRKRIGYMPGRFSLYPDLSVEENVRFFASVFGTTLEREYDQIAPIYSQLEPFKGRRAGALSGGMKQKLALSCALVHRPEILFLDEPTTGVDPVSRRELWDLLGRLRGSAGPKDPPYVRSGLTIVVSTPYMDEAGRCDRVALMQQGKLLAIDRPDRIAASYDRPLFAVRADNRYRALLALREHPHKEAVYPFGASLHYTDARTDASSGEIQADLTRFLTSKGLGEVEIDPIAATVEDVFMARMGEERA